jgi:PIN domain nuclease of toxin-antitoxin system
MRLLLDTHALLWWLAGDAALPRASRMAIADAGNEVFASAASAWEIATKFRIGKLPGVAAIVERLDSVIAEQGFLGLPVTVRHGQAAGALPGPHRDPFDRMLIAQALQEDMILISNEAVFEGYGVGRLW